MGWCEGARLLPVPEHPTSLGDGAKGQAVF